MKDEQNIFQKRELNSSQQFRNSIRRQSKSRLRNYSNGIRILSFEEQFNPKNSTYYNPKNNRRFVTPYFLAIILDPIIPILLILSSISCTSVMGMIFILILCIHVLICNNLKKSFNSLKICLLINLLFHIIVFIFSVIELTSPTNEILNSEAVKILGLKFKNNIISTPILPLVSSIIAILCQIISLALIPVTSFEEFCVLRLRIFSSTAFLFLMDFLWEICNTFNNSSNLSFFSLPLILYLCSSIVSISLTGTNHMPLIAVKIIMVYSIIYSFFELYMLSYIGELYGIKFAIHYNYIGPSNSKAANYVFAVIFSYASVQNLSAPGFSLSVIKKIPILVIAISNFLLLVEFFLCFLFALYYPNYLSFLWLIIPICASFVGMKTVKHFFFPLLVVTFTLTFIPIILTTFGIFRSPENDGLDYFIEFLHLFGLFRYTNDFKFSICGFFLMCFFGILGRITLAKVKKKKIPKINFEEFTEFERRSSENRSNKSVSDNSSRSRKDEDDKKNDNYSLLIKVAPENSNLSISSTTDGSIKNKSNKSEGYTENNEIEIEEQNEIPKFKRFLYFLFWFIKYICAFTIFIVGIAGSYYKDRFAFIVFGCILIIIVLLALYTRPVFVFIKIMASAFFIITCYFKITINEDCRENIDECLAFGHFGSYKQMINTGLVPPPTMSIPKFLWPQIVIFIVCTILLMVDSLWDTEEKEEIEIKIKRKKTDLFMKEVPGRVYDYAHFLVGLLHVVHLFAYPTNIYSIFFMIVGICVFASLYFNKKTFELVVCCFSSVFVSSYLIIYYFSHFDEPRNLITSIIPPGVIDISEIKTPTFEIALLTTLLVLTTMFTKSSNDDHFKFIELIFYEIRTIFHYFDFYLSWLFIFIFSIVNDNPSVIKFVLMIFFGCGQLLIPMFRKIRMGFMIFNILYLSAQLSCDVFDLDKKEHKYYEVLKYIGFFFSKNGQPTTKERNLSMVWQLACIYLGVICSKTYQEKEKNEVFEKLITTKLYRAIAAFLHFLLPVIVLSSLCISTMYNRSIFGWFTFIIMVLLTHRSEILYKSSKLITFLFNFLFILYYLFYLGFPKEVFHNSFKILDHVSNKDIAKDWFRYLGVYEIETSSLIANCISAFVFSIFFNIHNIYVDYESSFNALPNFLRSLIQLFVSYIYEITLIMLTIIASFIHTLDGFFYFLITSILLFLSLLFHYDNSRVLVILAHETFWTIALHLMSRMPIFTQEGLNSFIKKAFNLPFQSYSKYRDYWTAIYCLERICIHILKSDFYKKCHIAKNKRFAYRYIRSRKLKVISKLDQHILKNKDELFNQKIKNVNKDNFDEIMHDLSSSFELLTKDGLANASLTYYQQIQARNQRLKNNPKNDSSGKKSKSNSSSSGGKIRRSRSRFSNNLTIEYQPQHNNDNDNENDIINKENEDDDSYELEDETYFEVVENRRFIYHLNNLLKWLASRIIAFCALTFNPNCEAGLNVYTLQSIIEVMKRQLESYDIHKKSVILQEDYDFIRSLPPTFHYQYQSLADAVQFKIYKANQIYQILGRYFCMFIRRIAFVLLFLMVLVYIFSKPYIMGFFVLISFVFLFCSYYVPNNPNRFRIFMAISILVLTLCNIGRLDILKEVIEEESQKVFVQRMAISPFKLFCVDSASSIIPEILLYISTVLYIIDQRAWCELFTAKYYYQKFSKEVEGFPQNFSSGNPNETNIVKSLGMEVGKQKINRNLKKNLESRGLIETGHSVVMSILDAISLLMLIIFWSTWTKSNSVTILGNATMNFNFIINVEFIFILVIHVVLMLFFDYFHIAKVLFPMIFFNILWLSYTYCMCFFYIPAVNRNYHKGTLYFYVLLRILSSIVICHRIQKGKIVVEYQLLSFEKYWRTIIIKNKFILICPFIFELQSVLMWMSRKTYVGLIDFMMIRDFGMNLEILMSSHFDPKKKGPPQKQSVFLIGGFIIFLFLVLLFGPLFLMTDGTTTTNTNLPLSVSLKIGMTPFKPFYEADATITTVTKDQMQELFDNNSPSLNILVLGSNEDSSILKFQNDPPNFWFPNENEIEKTISILEGSSSFVEICPFYEITFIFQSPTTTANTHHITKYYKEECIKDTKERKRLISIFLREQIGSVYTFKNIPLLFIVPTSNSIVDSTDFTRDINMSLQTYESDQIEMILDNKTTSANISFLNTDYLTILLFSQPVPSENLIGSLIQQKGGIVGIYFLIIVTFGVVVRNTATSQLDKLWLDKMERPQKLYRIIVAINTYRAANDCENELKTTETLLLMLRSKETCMSLTKETEDDIEEDRFINRHK